ncbi:MAG: sensor histidine kinase, partial [Flavitalea sp.]
LAFLFVNFFFIVALHIISSGLILHREIMVEKEKALGEERCLKNQIELQLLSSKVNPHFLFNTLNNLYGISISDHQKVPGLLLKLSDLLRYSVYEAKEPFVPLKAEIAYLKNYIEFEQLRLGRRLELNVSMDTVADHSVSIAPMLLIVFLENAFKHSRNSREDKIYIDVSLQVTDDVIVFSVKNSYAVNEHRVVRDKHSGFGLESVRKRLQLLYRNRHQLQIEQTDKHYSVNLVLHTA